MGPAGRPGQSAGGRPAARAPELLELRHMYVCIRYKIDGLQWLDAYSHEPGNSKISNAGRLLPACRGSAHLTDSTSQGRASQAQAKRASQKAVAGAKQAGPAPGRAYVICKTAPRRIRIHVHAIGFKSPGLQQLFKKRAECRWTSCASFTCTLVRGSLCLVMTSFPPSVRHPSVV